MDPKSHQGITIKVRFPEMETRDHQEFTLDNMISKKFLQDNHQLIEKEATKDHQ